MGGLQWLPLDVSARGVFIQKDLCLEGGSVLRSLHPLSQRSPFYRDPPHLSVDKMTDRCKNITSPQILWRAVIMRRKLYLIDLDRANCITPMYEIKHTQILALH